VDGLALADPMDEGGRPGTPCSGRHGRMIEGGLLEGGAAPCRSEDRLRTPYTSDRLALAASRAPARLG